MSFLCILRFQHGHLYDPFTNQRVELADGAVYTMLTDAEPGFAPAKPAGVPFDPRRDALPRRAQEQALEGRPKWHLLPRDTRLYFEVHPPNGEVSHRFEVTLAEDLFLVGPAGNPNPQDAQLASCKCIAQPLSAGLPDVVYGDSLNNVRKNTYIHYFHNLGNPAGNVFDKLTLPDGTKLRALRDQLGGG